MADNDKKKSMSREQATQLYKDLQKNMAALKLKKAAQRATSGKSANVSGSDKAVAAEIAASIKAAMKRDEAGSRPGSTKRTSNAPVLEEFSGSEKTQLPWEGMPSHPGLQALFPRTNPGAISAVALVMLFAVIKVVLSALESSGFATVSIAQASLQSPAPISVMSASISERAGSATGTPEISKEEIRILTSLDARRVELEERGKKIDLRDRDLDLRDRELATKMSQLREMTEKLKGERQQDDKKRSTQLDQLANVYGSMNPPEAAQLLAQLDTSIALSLIERMPEKRIGQILALMSPEKALLMTRMLSGRGK
mgnify:CR=1 FL=1